MLATNRRGGHNFFDNLLAINAQSGWDSDARSFELSFELSSWEFSSSPGRGQLPGNRSWNAWSITIHFILTKAYYT